MKHLLAFSFVTGFFTAIVSDDRGRNLDSLFLSVAQLVSFKIHFVCVCMNLHLERLLLIWEHRQPALLVWVVEQVHGGA